MKVLALAIFAVASVSGLGSGPYLPSGWRPQGPSFLLPSEVQKPAENPLKDTILQETEASGSDALREYGPPKVVEVSHDLTRQALPDAVTEQAFVVIEAKFTEENGEVKEVGEVETIEEVVAGVTEAEEDSKVTSEEKTTEAVTEAIVETTAALESDAVQGKAIDVEETAEISEATTETVETSTAVEISETEESTAVKAEVDSNVESSQVDQVSQIQEVAEVKAVERVNNVVEALANLDKESRAQQVQTSGDTVEVKSVQVIGQEAPEGFLEYGPPGFREYGPPQADELARTTAVQQPEEEQNIENNETRRRRFSPKFRPSKKH